MKKIRCAPYWMVFILTALVFFTTGPAASAAGLFSAFETVSRQDGGLNTAIGYRYHQDTYEKGNGLKIRQNEIYSQAAYGADNAWEIYARLGIADLKIGDVFRENEEVFATLGGKVFYPISGKLGVGAFVQGTYYLNDFSDTVERRKHVQLKDLWDVHFGVALQATLPCGSTMYAGPYLYYSEGTLSLSSNVSDWGYAAGRYSVQNTSIAGGFAGLDIPLAKGFRLNVEGQYADRISAGAAISYTY